MKSRIDFTALTVWTIHNPDFPSYFLLMVHFGFRHFVPFSYDHPHLHLTQQSHFPTGALQMVHLMPDLSIKISIGALLISSSCGVKIFKTSADPWDRSAGHRLSGWSLWFLSMHPRASDNKRKRSSRYVAQSLFYSDLAGPVLPQVWWNLIS